MDTHLKTTTGIIAILLTFLIGYSNPSNAFNHIPKYDLYKPQKMEQKIDDLSTNIKDLATEIAALKKVNKKLLKKIQLDELMRDAPSKEMKSKERIFDISSPIKTNVNNRNPCPNSFELSTHRSCYHIEAERVTWTKARTMCMAIGGDLVSIESQSEHSYIVEHIKKSKIYRHCDIWTSGTDAGHEGRWTWKYKNTQKPMTFTRWQPDEPNNGGGIEHCLWMDWYFGWAWNDAKCDKDRACFICETPKKAV